MTEKQNNILKTITSLSAITLASFILSFNIKSFVNAGQVIPGGFTGISLLIQRSFSQFLNVDLPYSLINILLNSIPAFIGFRFIGKKFTTYTVLLIVMNSFMVDLIPVTPITYDPLLVSIFGGILNGTAISIALLGHASTGGTDFIAVYLSNKLKRSSWGFIFGLNCMILVLAGYLFGFEAAMYSIIFQFVSTNVIEKINKREQKVTLLIMTSVPDLIEEELMKYSKHGMTRFQGQGSYLKEDKTMFITVVGADNVKDMISIAQRVDPHVFIDVIKSMDVKGRFHMDPIE